MYSINILVNITYSQHEFLSL